MPVARTENYEEIKELCQRFHVRRLELFGSALDSEFDLTKAIATSR